MTPEEVRTAINAVLSDKIVLSWWQLVLVILLTGVAAYLGSYLKKKGENLATKEDVARLTHEVEAVRTNYLRQIEDYKAELTRRTNAVEVAEVLADFLYANAPDKKEFMTKVWKLSLTLPPDIVMQMATTIAEAKKSGTNPKELLVKVRKLIHGQADNVTAENLLHML
jgi:hypothetical protein